jgi:hypothetical protein
MFERLRTSGKKSTESVHMGVRRIRRRIRRQGEGSQVAADIDAVIATNEGEPGRVTKSSVRSRQRIVQRSGSRRRKPSEPEESRGGES